MRECKKVFSFLPFKFLTAAFQSDRATGTLMGVSSSKGWKLKQMLSLPLCCCESAQASSDWKSTWQTFNAGLGVAVQHNMPRWSAPWLSAQADTEQGECKGGISQLFPPQSWAQLGVSLENIYSAWKLFKLCTSTVTPNTHLARS